MLTATAFVPLTSTLLVVVNALARGIAYSAIVAPTVIVDTLVPYMLPQPLIAMDFVPSVLCAIPVTVFV